jgi:hypothetical protein
LPAKILKCAVFIPLKRCIINDLRWQASSYRGVGVRMFFTTQGRVAAATTSITKAINMAEVPIMKSKP